MKKGFTLIEILIVIAIIGILTVALLPRIQGAQASARNTARKADLNQVATALAAYNGDFGKYPETLTELEGGNGYLKSVPKDPANKSVCGDTNGAGGYYYARKGDGYVLAAYMEKQPGNPNVNYEGDCGESMAPSENKVTTRSDKAKYVVKVDN
ncbi:MAG TPA: prepilin-type N-terminal cleavage/methylation domain-containing protein [Candidatus Absconditabacterales bacterium]|nr:prepilin-type N-terminal cleavage/methylation domain-containing protein [Candidatus Absconditabacterales bacterium]HNG97132.1 prepilin-type N-terminal cleavage/methylation domain-containing protein [Candidatus Absconditabacterales bacterium]